MGGLNDERRKKDEQRTATALEKARKEQQSAMDAALRVSASKINSAEKKAVAAIERKLGGSPDFADCLPKIRDIFKVPGLRTAPGLERKQNPAAKAELVTDRPTGSNGAVSFHFAITSVSRGGELADVLSGQKSLSSARSTGKLHQKYIERNDVAEELGKAGEMQLYIENATKAQLHANVDLADSAEIVDKKYASFGNISDDPQERAKFWSLVEECEQKPSDPIVYLDPTIDPDLWQRLRQLPAKGFALPEPIQTALATNKPVKAKITNDLGFTILDTFAAAGLKVSKDLDARQNNTPKPLSFKLGFGGRVQTRIVLELPHELAPEQRLSLAREYCRDFGEKQLPYWGVIHAPGKNNDDRNYHLHVNLYDRPCRRIYDTDVHKEVWDIEIIEHFVTPRRQKRSRRPYQKEKVAEISKLAWVYSERARFAKLANEFLASAQLDKRLDPRTYAKMGVEQVAKERVSPASYARERKGEVTPDGVTLAKREWKSNENTVLLAASADIGYDRYRALWIQSALSDQISRGHDTALKTVRSAQALLKTAATKTALVIERNADAHIGAMLASRARLVPAKKRDEVDKAALEVSAEIQKHVVELEQQIEAVSKTAALQEQEMLRAKQADIEYLKATSTKRMHERLRGTTNALRAALIEEVEARERGEKAKTDTKKIKAAIAEAFPIDRELQRKANEARINPPKTAPIPISVSTKTKSLDPHNRPGAPVTGNPLPTEQQRNPPVDPMKSDAQQQRDLQRDIKKRINIARQRGNGGRER